MQPPWAAGKQRDGNRQSLAECFLGWELKLSWQSWGCFSKGLWWEQDGEHCCGLFPAFWERILVGEFREVSLKSGFVSATAGHLQKAVASPREGGPVIIDGQKDIPMGMKE